MHVENDDPADTRRLLASLSGLRDAAPPPNTVVPHGRRGRWLIASAAVAIAGAAGAAWWAYPRQAPAAPEPAAASAAPAPESAATSGSVLQASGFVVAKRQATVSASITGRIVRLHVSEGSHVKSGQAIAELDAGISAAQVAFAEAGVRAAEAAAEVTRARLHAARRNLSRSQDLATRGFVSPASLDQTAEAAQSLQAQLASDLSQVEVARRQLALQREQLRNVNIVSPFDGVVTELAAHVGEIVSPISGGGGFTRTGICTIVAFDSLEGEVDVSEQYLARLRKDQPVSVRFPAYPEVTLMGRVAALPAAVNRNTAAVKVRIAFDEAAQPLTPGMRAEFSFMTPPASRQATPAAKPAPPPSPAPSTPPSAKQARGTSSTTQPPVAPMSE